MAGPSTPFETNGGTAFTTYPQGETFIDAVIAGSVLAKKVTLGTTAGGRAITAVLLGYPTAPSLGDITECHFVVASQHGIEQSPREAAFQFVRDLAYNATSDDLIKLAQTPVIVIPTANPDGFVAGTRTNGNGVDLNRDHLALTQSETRCIASVIVSRNPLFVYDGHEASVASYQVNGAYFATDAAPSLKEYSTNVASEMTTLMAGYTYGPYDYTDHEGTLQSSASLRSLPCILVETLDGQTSVVKTEQHYKAMYGLYRYVCTNITATRTARTEAKNYYTYSGAEAYVPWYGYDGVTIPAQVGYIVYDYSRIKYLEMLGINVMYTTEVEEYPYVSMNQPSSYIAALVLDPVAPRKSVSAEAAPRTINYVAGRDSTMTLPNAVVQLGGSRMNAKLLITQVGGARLISWGA